MTTTSPKECSVCQENFNEGQRCPRILPCAHCVCTECIKGLIANNNKKCPYCHQAFSQNAAEDFKKISNVVDLINYIDELETNAISTDLFHTASKTQKMEFLKEHNMAVLTKSLEDCTMALGKIQFSKEKNNELKEHIIIINENIKDEVLAKVSEVIRRNELKVKGLEEKNKVVEEQRQEIEKLETSLLKARDLLSECNVSAFQDVAPIMDEIEETSSSLKECLETLKDIMSSVNEEQPQQQNIDDKETPEENLNEWPRNYLFGIPQEIHTPDFSPSSPTSPRPPTPRRDYSHNNR